MLFGKNKKVQKLFLHHEQSYAMAADVYGRIKKKPAVVCVTTGPGGINAINGVFGSYTDSVPDCYFWTSQISNQHGYKK